MGQHAVGVEDMPRRVPDLTKARTLVGYEPRVCLDDILLRVIEDTRRSLLTHSTT